MNLNIKNDEKMDEKSSVIPFEEDLQGNPCSRVASCTKHLPGLELLFAPQGRRMDGELVTRKSGNPAVNGVLL
jgi:hypothetical protein